MIFARRVFFIAGLYGLLILPPHYLMEEHIGRAHPPAITHPEFFYGFLGVAIAWQVAFLMIATDPARYRLIMLAGVLEKFSFGIAAIVLFSRQRLDEGMLIAGIGDLVWAALFIVAYRKTASGSELRGQAV
jgi:hypothetical protein